MPAAGSSDILLPDPGHPVGIPSTKAFSAFSKIGCRCRRVQVGDEADKRVWTPRLQAETARATGRLTVAYSYIPGSQSAAFKDISVFVGLTISPGSADFINQVMSGLVLVYSHSIKLVV